MQSASQVADAHPHSLHRLVHQRNNQRQHTRQRTPSSWNSSSSAQTQIAMRVAGHIATEVGVLFLRKAAVKNCLGRKNKPLYQRRLKPTRKEILAPDKPQASSACKVLELRPSASCYNKTMQRARRQAAPARTPSCTC